MKEALVLEDWIAKHGSTALKRALIEGYEVRMGVADQVTKQLTDALNMDAYGVWGSVAERTSPTTEAFEKRDAVLACIKTLTLPKGWSIDVTRISRISVDGAPRTGVLVLVLTDKTLVRQVALSFESRS